MANITHSPRVSTAMHCGLACAALEVMASTMDEACKLFTWSASKEEEMNSVRFGYSDRFQSIGCKINTELDMREMTKWRGEMAKLLAEMESVTQAIRERIEKEKATPEYAKVQKIRADAEYVLAMSDEDLRRVYSPGVLDPYRALNVLDAYGLWAANQGTRYFSSGEFDRLGHELKRVKDLLYSIA